MKREIRYPDTKSFKFFNANPKNRITGDCTFRAIATALEEDYNNIVMQMAEHMCVTGYALNDSKGENSFLASKGFRKMKQPKKINGTKYTGKEFCEYLTDHFPNGKGISNIIAHIGGHHIVCIKWDVDSFKVHDTWDSTYGCIGNYWIV